MSHRFATAVPAGSDFKTVSASSPDSANEYAPEGTEVWFGRLPTAAGRLYVEVVNPGGPKAPVLVLHGGPGMAHNYCAPMVSWTIGKERVGNFGF